MESEFLGGGAVVMSVRHLLSAWLEHDWLADCRREEWRKKPTHFSDPSEWEMKLCVSVSYASIFNFPGWDVPCTTRLASVTNPTDVMGGRSGRNFF
jgi:hypothetical protein